MQSVVSAERKLQSLFGITPEQAESVLSVARAGRENLMYADIYFQKGVSQAFSFEEGVLKRPQFQNTSGAGIYVSIGDKEGYSFCDHVTMKNLKKAAKDARAIANYSKDVTSVIGENGDDIPHNLYVIGQSPVFSVNFAQKLQLLKDIDAHARAYDKRITNVKIMLVVSDEEIVIANSLDKELFYDSRPLVRVRVECYAVDGEVAEKSAAGGGGRTDFDFFLNGQKWKEIATEAAKNAIALLTAVEAPPGEMDVVLGSGWSGVMVHEAVGHGLEGDFNRNKISVFSSRMGEMVASPVCTIIDDGALPGRRGSLNFDDQGVPTRKNVLIEKGRLVGYMQDRKNASLMGVRASGNGRRQDYRNKPMPRMTNTYIDAGDHTPEEIVASVQKGLYITTFGGGQVDITSGDFVFTAEAAHLIENGKIGPLVRGATLVGNGPKAMMKISMVGNDMALDAGVGTCGKAGQSVPVNVGMPHVRMNGMTVGGRGKKGA